MTLHPMGCRTWDPPWRGTRDTAPHGVQDMGPSMVERYSASSVMNPYIHASVVFAFAFVFVFVPAQLPPWQQALRHSAA